MKRNFPYERECDEYVKDTIRLIIFENSEISLRFSLSKILTLNSQLNSHFLFRMLKWDFFKGDFCFAKTCQTFLYYTNFQNSLQVRKNFKNYYGFIDLQNSP